MAKIGRNKKCPCGSGKKYKRCHGAANAVPTEGIPLKTVSPQFQEQIDRMQVRHEAMEARRKAVQGLGKGIITGELSGTRFVAVGSVLHYSKDWKTFHDFLNNYLKRFLGEWFKQQVKLEKKDQHDILRWFDLMTKSVQEFKEAGGNLQDGIPHTGASMAWHQLAYDLYSLEHNEEVRDELVHRLLHSDQFWGALCEVIVAAKLIRAGYRIKFEDEFDHSKSHCEFVATSNKSGRAFSVEVKHREIGYASSKVGRHLNSALGKEADHERLIFMEFFKGDINSEADAMRFFRQLSRRVSQIEKSNADDGKTAYLIYSSSGYYAALDEPLKPTAHFGDSYKILDYKANKSYPGTRAAYHAQQKHIELFDLLLSIKEHSDIPAEFEPKPPGGANAVVIGESYLFEGFGDIPGKVTTATVVEDEKRAYIGITLKSGESHILKYDMSDEDMKSYLEHPDTFFGVEQQTQKTANSPLELFQFFLEGYSQTPRAKLLELLEKAPDIEQLQNENDQALREILAERYVQAAINMQGIND